MTVWRYEVPVDDRTHAIEVPVDSRFVHVGCREDPGVVEVWAYVPPADPVKGDVEVRYLRVYGTGQEVPENATYVGTTMTPLRLVWHLFEEAEG